MTFAERLQTARVSAGITQKELAEKLDMNLRTYGSYERGERDVSTSMLLNICKALNISSDYLLGRSDNMHVVDSAATDSKDFSEKTAKKFGAYYSKNERDKIIKEMTDILATNPDLKTQIECQTEILKCCFSESLQHNNFNIRHCSFKDYVAMVLHQQEPDFPMSDECVYEMRERYGNLSGMAEGIIYDIPSETREERRVRHIMETIQKFNETGQLKVHDFVNYLADSGKYNKPDTDDDEIE